MINFDNFFKFYRDFDLVPKIISLRSSRLVFFQLFSIKEEKENDEGNLDKEKLTFDTFIESLCLSGLLKNEELKLKNILEVFNVMSKSAGISKSQKLSGKNL